MVTTPVFDIPLPTPGGHGDAWAPILNDAIIDLEAEVSRVEAAAAGTALDLTGKVNRSGDTLSGFLSAHADPTAAMHVATRQFVMANAAGLTDAPNDAFTYGRKALGWVKAVNLAGDTMTGALQVSAGSAATPSLRMGDPNSGLYGGVNTDVIGISTGGVARFAVSSSYLTNSLPMSFPLGSVTAPSLVPTSDPNTGIYSPGADQLAITTNGVQRLLIDTTAVTSTLPISLPAGTAAAPALMMGDTDSGLWGGAGAVRVSTDGVSRVTVSTTAVTSSLPVLLAGGAVGTPSFSFSGNPDTGMYAPSAGTVGLATAGVLRFHVGGSTILSNLPIALPADPVSALHAATKQYVDTKTGGGIKAVPQLEAVTNVAVVSWGTAAVSQGPMLAGNVTPLNGDADFLALRARRLSTPAGNGDNAEGAAIVLRGPSHSTTPNRVEMFAGTTAALKSWLFNADGTLVAMGGATFPGILIANAITSQYVNGGARTAENVIWPSQLQAGAWPQLLGGMIAVRGDQATNYPGGTVACYSGSGSTGVVLLPAATAWSTLSDEREKHHITPIGNGLRAIMALVPIRYLFRFEKEDARIRVGFGANNVNQHIPEAVTPVPKMGPDGKATAEERLALTPTDLLPHIVSAIQQIVARIEALEKPA